MVDVVCADDGAGKLLGQVILLIGHLCGNQDAYAVRAVLGHDGLEPVGCEADRLLPSAFIEPPIAFDERRFEAHETVHVLVEVPTLDAEFALIHGMGLHGHGAHELSIQDLEKDSTPCAAIGTC